MIYLRNIYQEYKVSNISTQYLPILEDISTEGGGHAAPDVLGDVQDVGGRGHAVLAALLLHLRGRN